VKRSGLVLALAVVAAGAFPVTARAAGKFGDGSDPLCTSGSGLCTDVFTSPGYEYVGHDEPSVLFKSAVPGSGNDLTYTITLPRDPVIQPTNSGPGATWNFQLRSTFWFGMTMCDSESAPEFTKTCTPDSDRNDLEGLNPNRPDYIGKHPGNAYMELQFYGPGFVPQFEGFGCTAHQYCANLTIDSFVSDQNTGIDNTAACNNFVLGGVEPINWAYITRSGIPQAPANPLASGTLDNPNFTQLNPDPAKVLLMNPGDRIRMHMHDTAAGFRVEMTDLTTGQSGSMTASVANGFGHILYTPNSTTCHEAPYAFHPEYSTGIPRGNTWSAHTYNIAASDEIGHFENCIKLDDTGANCAVPGVFDGRTPDTDDGQDFCVSAADSALVKINGCLFDDEDFDGQSYRNDWPGTFPNPFLDAIFHPEPMRFTSPLINGHIPVSTVAFEADLPRIEADDSQFDPPFCDRTTGAHCVNPPRGAQFYPIYTTAFVNGSCNWQQGGNFIPGTVEHFGGNSTREYGRLLQTPYPDTGFTIRKRFNNFNSGDFRNPCT
jgi:hypothetical protein